MPKSSRRGKMAQEKARAVASVKRSQEIIRKFEKREDWPLTPQETRNAFHEGYPGGKGVSVKFKKRSARKK